MKVVALASAVLLAVVANVLLYVLVTGPLGEPLLMCEDCRATPPRLNPMDVDDPILFSTLFGTAAMVVYVVIDARSARPVRTFTVVATAVLLGSIALPAMIPSPPVSGVAKLALIAMHVVGYAVIVATLWVAHARGILVDRNDT